jgi:hypothetical protein
MNIDFHYCCIKTLAFKAGFAADEAEVIAYASQYTDDATEHKKIRVTGGPAWAAPQYDGAVIDPVCTAHGGSGRFTTLLKWARFYTKTAVQQKVLMPFHFVPPEAHGKGLRFDYVVQAKGRIAEKLVQGACRYIGQGNSQDRRLYGLVKLGIALHSYADTFSHQGFSGRHSSDENDITGIRIRGSGQQWKAAGLPEWFVYHVAPDIGHSEAGSLPDDGHAVWSFRYANKAGPEGIRDNPQVFLDAARRIFEILCDAAGKGQASHWDGMSTDIGKCIVGGRDAWSKAFKGQLSFEYDPLSWRQAALTGSSVRWDDFNSEREFRKLSFTYAGDPKWFLFHRAAADQRCFVMARLP